MDFPCSSIHSLFHDVKWTLHSCDAHSAPQQHLKCSAQPLIHPHTHSNTRMQFGMWTETERTRTVNPSTVGRQTAPTNVPQPPCSLGDLASELKPSPLKYCDNTARKSEELWPGNSISKNDITKRTPKHRHTHTHTCRLDTSEDTNWRWLNESYMHFIASLTTFRTAMDARGPSGASAWKSTHLTHSRVGIKSTCQVQLQHPPPCIRICKCHSTLDRSDWAHTLGKKKNPASSILVLINTRAVARWGWLDGWWWWWWGEILMFDKEWWKWWSRWLQDKNISHFGF